MKTAVITSMLGRNSELRSLTDDEKSKVEDLNDRINGMNKPIQIYSIAYFEVLFQISEI